jgi:uncharacterized protein YqjF (DUF2071 family)
VRDFLTASWRDILLVTFEAPAARLGPLVPPGCTLDTWQGRAYVSLVALHMAGVRIRGLPVPGHTAFPQVNLRFYVRHAERPAVCFVEELVPKRLLVAGARWLYGEPFRAGYIHLRLTETAAGPAAEYRFGPRGPDARLRVSGGQVLPAPSPDSFGHWVKERTRGCRAGSGGRLRTFDVAHPPWSVRRVDAMEVDVPFARLYGPTWAFLDGAEPASVLYAVGSEVTVGLPT